MRSDWIVKELAAKDDLVYESFLNELSTAQPCVLGYHFPFYRNILESCGIGRPHYTALFIGDKLSAVLPGLIRTSEAGTAFCSMPFFGPNAGIMCNNKEISGDAHEILINHVIEYMKREHKPLTVSFYTPFLSDDFDFYRKNLADYYEVEKNTQFLEIQTTEWDNKIKYDLRKAERLGVTISEEITSHRVNELIAIYRQNCADYNIPPKPDKFIHELAKAASERKNTEFYFTYHEGRMIGGLIVIYSKSTLSYYLPCALDDKRTLQPVTCLIDYAFQKAKSRGLSYWNWESSPDQESGVYKFKRKWGSTDSYYRIFVKSLCDLSYLKSIGSDVISKQFPYFFVFPFHKM